MNERKLKIRDGKDDNVRVKINRKKTANDLEKERKNTMNTVSLLGSLKGYRQTLLKYRFRPDLC